MLYSFQIYCNIIFVVYGVFARKTIPSRTQFGPVEGVLIKQEGTICGNDDENVLQLTVETEKGIFFKLDVSNEGMFDFYFEINLS